MSVIAAKVYSDTICIAADSILIKDDLKKTDFIKLKQIGETICGGCGCAEELCLFFDFVSSNKLENASISGLIVYMHEFQTYLENTCKKENIENTYLIIQNNKLFEVEGFFVQEITDYTAIGAGEAYALTALHCDKDPVEAVKIACKLCTAVSEPVIHYVYNKE